MAAKNQVTLTFAGDDTKLKRTFDSVGDSSDRMQRRVNSANDTFSVGEDRAGSFGMMLGRLGVAAAAAAVAVTAAATAMGTDSIKAFVGAEAAQAKLEEAFQRFPRLAGANIEAFKRLNSELAKKTRFDDDATAVAQAVLAQYKLTAKQLQTLTPLVQDYAAKTGRDLPTAAEVLGKALLGKGKALADVGIQFKDAGTLGKNFDQIVGGLRRQVGGFAEQEGKTSAGQLEILKNRFGELQETLGERLLPVVFDATEGIVEFVETGFTKFDELGGAVDELGLTNLPGLKSAFEDVGRVVKDELGVSLQELRGFIRDNREEIDKFIVQASGLVKDTGPALAFTVRVLAISFQMGANNVMALVDGLDALKTWYMNNISWLSPWANLMLKLTNANVQMAGQKMTQPNVPRFHDGGVVPGAPGTETLAILQAGEHVTPNGGGGGASRVVLELRSSGSRVDDLLMEILSRAVNDRGGNVQVAVERRR